VQKITKGLLNDPSLVAQLAEIRRNANHHGSR
jgi:hypothetical protein